jgi:hypothetical protein
MLFALLTLSSAWAGSLTLGTGTVVVVTDVASTDPNKGDRAALLGEVCAVGKTPLVSSGDGWWKGSLACANGVVYTTTAVSVAVPGTLPQPRSVSATAIAAQIDKTIRFDASATPATPAPAPVVVAPPPPAGPDGAPADSLRRVVHAGEAVRIVGLSREDAYYSDRESIVGKDCYPTDEMSYNDDGWHGGPMACWDGDTYYFYKVGLAPDPTHANQDLGGASGGVAGGALGGVIGGYPDGGGDAPAPGSLDDGTRVTIRDVAPDDAFYSDRTSLIGKQCKVTGDLHPQGGGGWYGGGLTCKKNYYYFYKVRVDVK